ncbi:hypothetical protein [Microbacterium sp. NPDC076911]|uniref:hypothetical protein n=1 Tax=Microbacterium sp. NPDC076911 TaxID=3154958 RepID=UPI0034121EF2
MGTVPLEAPRPSYLEGHVEDPEKELARAREIVRADRKRRAQYSINARTTRS